MVFYLNWKGTQGRETVDELERNDFANYKAFKVEINRLISEYAMAGMGGVYSSSRMCANWKS
jgi:hypothetical protein